MFIIDTNREDVLEDFPFIQEWIDTAQKVFIKKEIDESKIEFYYSYGFFVPKVENKQELYKLIERFPQINIGVGSRFIYHNNKIQIEE